MKSSPVARLLRLGGWALPILAALWCAPSVARADCGDYVVTRLTHADQAIVPGQQHPADAPAPVKSHKPCNGPHCSNSPTVPLLPAPTVPPPTSHEWGLASGMPDLAAFGRGALLFESSPQHPVRLAHGIFHPPRFAA